MQHYVEVGMTTPDMAYSPCNAKFLAPVSCKVTAAVRMHCLQTHLMGAGSSMCARFLVNALGDESWRGVVSLTSILNLLPKG